MVFAENKYYGIRPTAKGDVRTERSRGGCWGDVNGGNVFHGKKFQKEEEEMEEEETQRKKKRKMGRKRRRRKRRRTIGTINTLQLQKTFQRNPSFYAYDCSDARCI